MEELPKEDWLYIYHAVQERREIDKIESKDPLTKEEILTSARVESFLFKKALM